MVDLGGWHAAAVVIVAVAAVANAGAVAADAVGIVGDAAGDCRLAAKAATVEGLADHDLAVSIELHWQAVADCGHAKAMKPSYRAEMRQVDRTVDAYADAIATARVGVD